MGNAPDQTVDKAFMQQTQMLMENFADDDPLYHVEQIKFPLSTDQMKIVDATGRRVKLAGGNWSGGHMCRHCVDGLQFRTLRDIAMDIRFKFKMNCIRLTYSLQLIYDDNIIPQKYLKANPDLIGKTSMQVFDITVKTLTQVGLMVILNNHTSTSQWCCSNDDGDGLWWSRRYPQYMFFDHVKQFAKRYRNNQRVIGMDMRNQIRKANGLEPSWGDGNPKTDWKRAAQISAEIALKQAPHWLILIGGVNYQLDLTGVKDNPIRLSVPRKLVYTGHFYGFSWPIPSWQVISYQSFKKRLFNSQTYVRSLGVPYLLGEYGNNNQDIPWKYLMQYLGQTGIDWTYWALDGFKCQPQKDETYGVFTNNFAEARHPQMLRDMIKVGPSASALANYEKYRILKTSKSSLSHDETKVATKPLTYDDTLIPTHKDKVQGSYKNVQNPSLKPNQGYQRQYKLGSKQTVQKNANFLLSEQTPVQQTSNQKSKKYFQQINNYANQIRSNNPTTNVNQYGNQPHSQPSYNQPYSQPSYNQPSYNQPSFNQPTYNQPTFNQPHGQQFNQAPNQYSNQPYSQGTNQYNQGYSQNPQYQQQNFSQLPNNPNARTYTQNLPSSQNQANQNPRSTQYK